MYKKNFLFENHKFLNDYFCDVIYFFEILTKVGTIKLQIFIILNTKELYWNKVQKQKNLLLTK